MTDCVADIKYAEDYDKNEYLVFLCHFEKSIKLKAKILIRPDGAILGLNATTSTLLELPCASLRAILGKNINQIFSRKLVDMKHLISSKAKNKASGGERMYTNEFFKRNLVLTSPESKLQRQSLKPSKERLSPLSGTRLDKNYKTRKSCSTQDTEEHRNIHFEVKHPSNASDPRTTLLYIWSEESLAALGSENTGNGSAQSRIITKSYRPDSRFYFYLSPKFELTGSFDPQYALKGSNLDVKQLKFSSMSQIRDQAVRLLYGLKVEKSGDFEAALVHRVDYGAGIRVRRLKDGNILDWYEGMDIDSEYNESVESEAREGLQAPLNLRKGRLGSLGSGPRSGPQTTHKKSRAQKGNILSRKRRKKAFEEFEDTSEGFDSVEANIAFIKKMTNKSKLNKLFSEKRISWPLKFIVLGLTLSTFILLTNMIISTLVRSSISKDLKLFASIDYAITFRLADLYNIQSWLTMITLANNGTKVNANFRNPAIRNEKIEKTVKNGLFEIKKSLDYFEKFNKDFHNSMNDLSLADVFHHEVGLKKIKVVRSGVSEIFSINEIVRQLVTTVLSIVETSPLGITFDNPDVKWFMENCNGGIMKGLTDFTSFVNIIKNEAINRKNDNDKLNSTTLLAVLVVFVPGFYLLAFFYYRSQEEFVETFYGFEQHKVKRVSKRYERYLQLLQLHQIEEGEMDLSNSDASEGLSGLGGSSSGEVRGRARLGFGRSASLDDMIFRLRHKKKKGSMVPCLGFFHLTTLVPLLLFISWRFLEFRYQNKVISESIEILSTVEEIALSEMMNYASLVTMELSMYDFGVYGKTYMGRPLDEMREYYVEQAGKINDMSLRVGWMGGFERPGIVFLVNFCRIFNFYRKNFFADFAIFQLFERIHGISLLLSA